MTSKVFFFNKRYGQMGTFPFCFLTNGWRVSTAGPAWGEPHSKALILGIFVLFFFGLEVRFFFSQFSRPYQCLFCPKR